MPDHLEINDLSHLSDEEFRALCPIGEHAPGPEPLSPAAQAVLDAYGHEVGGIAAITSYERRGIAADLLSQLSAAAPAVVPVPVSERLPGPEDCDAEGRCWWLAPETAQKCAVWCFGPKYPPSMFGATHWLPANALPLPAPEGGEAQP